MLRAKKKIEVGLPINEYYAAPDNDWYTGKVIRVAPNKWTVQYDVDKTVSEITDINHLRKYIHVTKLPQWQECVDKVKAGFKYLEQRLTDDCPAPYHCKEQHEALGLLRAFEPSFACANVDAAYARKLAALKPYAHLQCADALVQELPIYLAAARSFSCPCRESIPEFTSKMLSWWKANAPQLPNWSRAARIAFALSPNSASCERVFSLLKCMFGDVQMNSLSDQLQAALLLRVNRGGLE